MKILIMKLTIINSTMLIFLKNPMSIMIIMIMKTSMISMLMNLMSVSSWFPMMFFLMMVGGILIIFSYMTSTVSNEKFKFKMNITMLLLLMTMPMETMMMNELIQEKESFMTKIDLIKMSMSKLYNFKSIQMSMLMIFYLFVTMIMVSKLIMKTMGPLRSKN
uniref:NADH dehydrogenase subunit 6 n=1 Tax=Batracomorphus nigromarginattus TaxID=1962548 RepID=UPI00257B3D02|nr:NADH dehydrogenase subunit 6 [Batracomorphus nigromarginattus]WHE42674.1 NADH dehydrogenase subunit 6 [Batracomorphus nigromarginattus]